jgi:hypothetical protein
LHVHNRSLAGHRANIKEEEDHCPLSSSGRLRGAGTLFSPEPAFQCDPAWWEAGQCGSERTGHLELTLWVAATCLPPARPPAAPDGQSHNPCLFLTQGPFCCRLRLSTQCECSAFVLRLKNEHFAQQALALASALFF